MAGATATCITGAMLLIAFAHNNYWIAVLCFLLQCHALYVVLCVTMCVLCMYHDVCIYVLYVYMYVSIHVPVNIDHNNALLGLHEISV